MNFYRRHWYDIGCLLFMALAFTAGLWTPRFSHIQVILIYSFMALLVHQYEEYAAPGGFPGIFNIPVLGERQVPERYPLNENQVLITNVFLAYPFYIAAIIWPNLIWLGLAQVFFGMLQLIVQVVSEFPAINCVVNNAGVQLRMSFAPGNILDDQAIQYEIDTDLLEIDAHARSAHMGKYAVSSFEARLAAVRKLESAVGF